MAGLVTNVGPTVTRTWTVPDSNLIIGGDYQDLAVVTDTGTKNNYAPTGLSFYAGRVSTLICNNASLLTIQGIAGGVSGALLEIISIGAGQVDLAHQNTGSTDINRLINHATSASSSLAAGAGKALYTYVNDGTISRWRMIHHEQGDWITPAYAGGDYTASGSMTWTVDSGDVTTAAYYLRGRQLSYAFQVVTTTVGGTPSTTLKRVVPGGFTTSKAQRSPCYLKDNGTVASGIVETAAAGGTVLSFSRQDGSNFSASTNATIVAVDGCVAVN